MDFNLNSFCSNLILIALVLVGLCCLYLLYSYFKKVRLIEELNRRVEDLKKIFMNQQLHNEETFSKIKTVLYEKLIENSQNASATPDSNSSNSASSGAGNSACGGERLDVNNEIAKEVSSELTEQVSPTKTINLDIIDADTLESANRTNNIIINKEGHISDNVSTLLKKTNTVETNTKENKEINIDLHDLDNLDDANDSDPNLDGDMNMDELNLDENCEEIDADAMSSSNVRGGNLNRSGQDEPITKDNLFNLDEVAITNAEIFDDLEDTLSIATAPIDETNDIINHNSNFNLDDIQDIQDIQDIDDIQDIKTVALDTSKADDIDLSELLNGNAINQIKKSDSEHRGEVHSSINTDTQKENVKTIDIDAPKSEYNNMSVKQLKDIAKSLGLKTTGTKQELIQLILAHETK